MNGILFDNKHSYYDWNLVLSSVDIPPAKPKTTYVDIPGGDGSIDLTEANGEVKYSNRECKFTFTVLDEYASHDGKKTEVSNYLNGRNCKITLDEDQEYYYQGRCTINDYSSDKNICKIEVVANVKPYKFKKDVTVQQINLSMEAADVYVINSRKSVVPEIICTNDNTMVVFDNREVSLSAGAHKILDFQLKEGSNKFTVSGSGTITFRYQEADL